MCARARCSTCLRDRFAQRAKSQCAFAFECASVASLTRGVSVPVIGTQSSSDPPGARARDQRKTIGDYREAQASVPAESTPFADAADAHTPIAAVDDAPAAVVHNIAVADLSVAASESVSV